MKLLLKKARILHPDSPFDGQAFDILIENGYIRSIAPQIARTGIQVIESPGLSISPGWMDVGAQTGDPGHEHQEDLRSVTKAAAAGGFTALAPFPNTQPVIQTKSEIQYILNATKNSLVDFYPIGALSQNCEGKDITEMYDMRQAGAIAFGDGDKSIQHGGVLMRALQYVKPFDGIILNQPFDQTIAGKGLMHEGITSTMLGVRGIPALSEEVMAQRDLSLLEYTASRLHFPFVSTAGTVELIRRAKGHGLKITASVAAMHLLLDDTALHDFDSNLKVLPPLRERVDMDALKAGLADGTIDFIASQHVPLDVEQKNLEFPYAEFGAIGLETAFAVANTSLSQMLSISEIISRFSIQPRRIFGIPVPEIKEGSPANLTIFDPGLKWTFSEKDIFSKSANTPFVGVEFVGKVIGVVNNGQAFVHQ